MGEPVVETFPVSRSQERLFLLDRVDTSGVQYAIVDAMTTDPGLSPDRFADCVRSVVARHEALRTTFAWEAVGPVQRVHAALDPEISTLSQVSADDLPGLVDRQARRPFDLERGPLFRVLLVELTDSRWAV